MTPTIQATWTIVSLASLTLPNVPNNFNINIIGSANNNSIDNLGTLPNVNGTCFTDQAMVLMSDYTFKKISEIKRGDNIISDFTAGTLLNDTIYKNLVFINFRFFNIS